MSAAPYHNDHSTDLATRREERRLIAYIRAGDAAAFERLVKKYSEKMVRFAASQTGSWDAAQDIVQEIFVSIWMRHATWQVNTSLAAYLYKSVVHGVAKHVRSQRSHTSLETLPIQSDTESGTELDEQEIVATAEHTIANLPQQTRTIFLLTREQHLSYSSAAQQLGVSIKTIEKHMSRALTALRKALKDWK